MLHQITPVVESIPLPAAFGFAMHRLPTILPFVVPDLHVQLQDLPSVLAAIGQLPFEQS